MNVRRGHRDGRPVAARYAISRPRSRVGIQQGRYAARRVSPGPDRRLVGSRGRALEAPLMTVRIFQSKTLGARTRSACCSTAALRVHFLGTCTLQQVLGLLRAKGRPGRLARRHLVAFAGLCRSWSPASRPRLVMAAGIGPTRRRHNVGDRGPVHGHSGPAWTGTFIITESITAFAFIPGLDRRLGRGSPRHEAGMASGSSNTSQQLGGRLAVRWRTRSRHAYTTPPPTTPMLNQGAAPAAALTGGASGRSGMRT